MPEACLGLTVGTASFGPDSQNGLDGSEPTRGRRSRQRGLSGPVEELGDITGDFHRPGAPVGSLGKVQM